MKKITLSNAMSMTLPALKIIKKHAQMTLPLLCLLTQPVAANSALVNTTQHASKEQAAHHQQREAAFKATEKDLKEQQNKLLKQRNALQMSSEKLAQKFTLNENKLAQLEADVQLETGSLGELFAVVRQAAKEVKQDTKESITAVDRQQYKSLINDISEAEALPSMAALTGLWLAMVEQIEASAELVRIRIPFVDAQGNMTTSEAYRLGSIGLIGAHGYLTWDENRQFARSYSQQPQQGPSFSDLAEIEKNGMAHFVVDPSRGKMLSQLAAAPQLTDRLDNAGLVGKVILALLGIGAVITLVRAVQLLIIRRQITQQLKQPQVPGNNPLGRILSVYDKDKKQSLDALELRLLEAVVDQQQDLEKGLSMLKLLAALAPMLGLLGTVTGMIETFQVITQFGNGDPKIMAGGISMALMTTVLGLIAAMPLLLAHNILSSQADIVRNILEKQGVRLVAEQAEKVGISA